MSDRPTDPSTRRHERGATLIIGAISLVALFTAAALAVDLGALWTSKRELVTATDASALEGALATIGGAADACTTDVPGRFTENHGEGTIVDCEVVESGANGISTVTATETTELMFAPLFGQDLAIETSATTVEWGVPLTARGVLPIGLCIDEPRLQQYIMNPDVALTVILDYDKANPNDCGGNKVPGNWGMLALNCHLPDVAPNCKSNNANLKDWIEHGYPGEVFAGDPLLANPCTPHVNLGCYGGDPGSGGGSFSSEFGSHIGEEWVFPIYGDASKNGSNARFHIIGFVNARIDDFSFTGGPYAPCGGLRRCMILTLSPGIIQGTCCAASDAIDAGARIVRICGVMPGENGHCHNAGLLP